MLNKRYFFKHFCIFLHKTLNYRLMNRKATIILALYLATMSACHKDDDIPEEPVPETEEPTTPSDEDDEKGFSLGDIPVEEI